MEKDAKKKINKITVLSIGITLVTIVIALVFIYAPFVNRNKTLRAEILRERERNVLVGKIRALAKHTKFYEERIPEEGRGVSWLLREVSDMATKGQIELSSIKPGDPEQRKQYDRLYITMEIVSTFHQLGDFLSRIESSEKFLRIESIDVERLDADKGLFGKSSKFKSYDVKSNIVVSTLIFN